MVMIKYKDSSALRLLLLLFFVSIMTTRIVAAAEVQEDYPGFTSGQELIVRGSYPEAIALFREISLSSNDTHIRANALFHIGSIYENYLDLPENAIDSYKDLTLMYPESPTAPDALFNIGRLYYKNERYAEAYKAFEDYMERYPSGARMISVKSWAESAERKSQKDPSPSHKSIGLTTLDPGIRVLLTRKTDSIRIDGQSSLTVRSIDKGSLLFEGMGPITFSRKGKRLLLNGKAVDADACRIMHQGEWLRVGGRRYRGLLAVHLKPSGLMAVNHLDIESYLYGVVPKEMSPLWAPEALVAQAIASRTFALYIRGKHTSGDKAYDLEATTSSQVYGGLDAEKESARTAVDSSKGMVLAHQDKLIISYFHSNSGGYTESSLNVWGADIPYLKSVEDSYSTEQPISPWEYTLSYKELSRIFSKSLSGKSLRKIEPQEKSPSGRILSFILYSDDKQVKVSGNSFRMNLGPVNMKSTICDVIPEKTGVKFRGTGYGHGVGMSQHGAQRMALSGLTSEAILKHYYKDVEILKISYL